MSTKLPSSAIRNRDAATSHSFLAQEPLDLRHRLGTVGKPQLEHESLFGREQALEAFEAHHRQEGNRCSAHGTK